jgi:hypothetical protein
LVPVLLVEPEDPPGAVLEDAAPGPPGVELLLPAPDVDPLEPPLLPGDEPPGVVVFDPGVVPAAAPVSLLPAVPAPPLPPAMPAPLLPPADPVVPLPPAAPPAPALLLPPAAPGSVEPVLALGVAVELAPGDVEALLLGLPAGLLAVDELPLSLPVEPVVASFLPQAPNARVATIAPSNIEYFIFISSPLNKFSLKHSTCT